MRDLAYFLTIARWEECECFCVWLPECEWLSGREASAVPEKQGGWRLGSGSGGTGFILTQGATKRNSKPNCSNAACSPDLTTKFNTWVRF